MTDVPFFNFAASINTQSEEGSPLAIRDDLEDSMNQPENPNPAIMDQIREIFGTHCSEEEDGEFRFRMEQPALLLPNPISQTKYGQAKQATQYEGIPGIENSFSNFADPANVAFPKPMTLPNLNIEPAPQIQNPRNTTPTPFYNIQVNDDIYLIERIESIMYQITDNHDPHCPFCMKFIDLKRCNFQNISAYYSKSNRKHYLTHFDCYYRVKDRSPNIKSLAEVPVAKINYQEQTIDPTQFIRKDRKIYFMSLEALHPISSYLHFKIEKSGFAMEETQQQGKKILHFDFEKRTTSIYEPNAYVAVYPEFRCQMVVANCPSNEEPFTFEFVVNSSSVNVTSEYPEKQVEYIYNQNGNQIYLGFQVILDMDYFVLNSLNYRLPLFPRSSQEPPRIMVLKYITMTLPLSRKNGYQCFSSADIQSLSQEEAHHAFYSAQRANCQLQGFSHQFSNGPNSFNFKDSFVYGQDGYLDSKTQNHSQIYVRKDTKSLSSITPRTNFDFVNYIGKSGQDSTATGLVLNKSNSSGRPSYPLLNFDDPANLSMGKSSFLAYYNAEEFKVGEGGFKLSDYQGRLYELSKSPSGSQAMQTFISKASSSELDIIINEFKFHIQEILLDTHASHLLQILLQTASQQQRYTLFKSIVPYISPVSRDKKGTHSLQGIVTTLKTEEEEQLLEDISDDVAELAKDTYGTHFIQKLVSTVSSERLSFIYQAIVDDFVDVASNTYGLCVVKMLITRIEKDEEKKKTVIKLLAENIDTLIHNPFGNYAIQHAFETFKHECGPLCDEIAPKFAHYGNQKFSSNVVEKCLETASPENRLKLTEAVIKSDKLIELMTNKYGNFVLLKVYNLNGETERKSIQAAFQKVFPKIHSNKYKTRWTLFFEECAKQAPEISTKILNKQSKPNKEQHLAEDTKLKIPVISGDFEELNGNKKQTKNSNTHTPKAGLVDNTLVGRSKNRKYSAPISGPNMKFVSNFY